MLLAFLLVDSNFEFVTKNIFNNFKSARKRINPIFNIDSKKMGGEGAWFEMESF